MDTNLVEAPPFSVNNDTTQPFYLGVGSADIWGSNGVIGPQSNCNLNSLKCVVDAKRYNWIGPCDVLIP